MAALTDMSVQPYHIQITFSMITLALWESTAKHSLLHCIQATIAAKRVH